MARSKKKTRRSRRPSRLNNDMRLIVDNPHRIKDMSRGIQLKVDEIGGQTKQLMAIHNELSFTSRKLGRPVRSMLQRTLDTIELDIDLLLIQQNRLLSAGEDEISETQKRQKPNQKTPKKNVKK